MSGAIPLFPIIVYGVNGDNFTFTIMIITVLFNEFNVCVHYSVWIFRLDCLLCGARNK